MISKYPHCQKAIPLSDTQKAKIQKAVAKLKPGTSLKLGCPICKKNIELSAPKPAADKGKPARPDKAASSGTKPVEKNPPPKPSPQPASQSVVKTVKPPDPPDISWLSQGELSETEMARDVPTAMILMPGDEERKIAAKVFESNGYQLFYPETISEAIRIMQFKDFAAVAFHTGVENKPLEESIFHGHMMKMSMTKRRYIFYLLMGDEFNTLYDLEALAYSANLVVNVKELPYLEIIVKKGLRDYDQLFGPYIDTLKKHGKR